MAKSERLELADQSTKRVPLGTSRRQEEEIERSPTPLLTRLRRWKKTSTEEASTGMT